MKIDKVYINEDNEIDVLSVIPEEKDVLTIDFDNGEFNIENGTNKSCFDGRWERVQYSNCAFVGYYNKIFCGKARYASESIKNIFARYNHSRILLYSDPLCIIRSPLWIAGILKTCELYDAKNNDEKNNDENVLRVIPFTSEAEAKKYISERYTYYKDPEDPNVAPIDIEKAFCVREARG